MNMKKTVVVGVTGGIAAFKILDLVEKLKRDYRVVVTMTQSATKIVAPKVFEKTIGNKVLTELFEKNFDYRDVLKNRKVEHISLAQTANIIVVAPATANILAKLASGIADDYLTTTILAATCPIVLCPSMNVHMWHNPATQKNIKILKSFGYHIIDPDTGMLACGYEGQGRLAAIDTILTEIQKYLQKNQSLKNVRIVVTAGGTREPIDDVRFITNNSSGKMGVAVAEECFLRGAHVLLLRARSSVQPRYSISEKTFETADELEKHLDKERFDVCIHTAAVSDFSVTKTKGKLQSNKKYSLVLTPRQKILDRIKKKNPKAFLVGFKAEVGLTDEQLIEEAKKLPADMVVANHVGLPDRGFESDNNEVFVITKKVYHIQLQNKRVIAERIIDELLRARKH